VPASPYSPTSRRFINPLYLRVDGTPPANAIGGDLIDYDAVWTAKSAALGVPASADLPDDPALRDFATYCALSEVHGRNWRDWPEPLRHPAKPAVAAARAELAGRVAFHA